jgi:4a-hydroxytetrahydrobiopterin dehydratase
MESNCSLSNKKCVPCTKGLPPLKGSQLIALHEELGNSWQVIEDHHLEKDYFFSNFKEALNFTNKVGLLKFNFGHIKLTGCPKVILYSQRSVIKFISNSRYC